MYLYSGNTRMCIYSIVYERGKLVMISMLD